MDHYIANNWANERSHDVAVSLMFFHGETQFYTFCKLRIFREDMGNHFEKDTECEAFAAYPFANDDGGAMLVLDVLFCCLISYVALSELAELLPVLCRNGIVRGFSLYIGIWNTIDWFNICMSLAIVGHYTVTLNKVNILNSELLDLFDDTGMESERILVLAEAFIAMEDVVVHYRTLTVLAAIFFISAVLAFFKAFRANEGATMSGFAHALSALKSPSIHGNRARKIEESLALG